MMRKLGWFPNEHGAWRVRPWLEWVLRRIFGLDVIPKVAPGTCDEDDGYFGVCPFCHKNDGHINVGRSHWFLFHQHKVKWCVGANLLSSWRGQTQDEQRAIYNRLGVGTYRELACWGWPAEHTMHAKARQPPI